MALQASWSNWLKAFSRSPFFAALLVFAVAVLITSPWGNYALNDDWTYAHVSKRFGETGVLKIDTPVVANTIGQALLAGPVIAVFGFSFTVMRVYTLLLAALCLWLIDRVLFRVTDRWWLRFTALVVLGLNPIFFYSAETFMSEIYGWLPGLIAAALWFDERARAPEDGTVSRVWVAALVGALTGFQFWIRQPYVVIFPALLGATVVGELLARRSRRLLRSLPALGSSVAAFIAVVVLFFVWAKATGNFPNEFQKRLPNMLRFNLNTWVMQTSAAVTYMTAYFLPFLVLVALRSRLRWPTALVSASLLCWLLWGRNLFERAAGTDYGMGMNWIHKSFPFLMNILYNAGVGPITTTDVFWGGAPGPSWPGWQMKTVEYIVFAATLLWGPTLVALFRQLKASKGRLRAEVLVFAVLLPMGGLAAAVQGVQLEVLDRYHFPLILGFAILTPAAFAARLRLKEKELTLERALVFLLCFAPVAWFSVGGLHDMFRWNDARWALIAKAKELGGGPATIEAGFEYNCWNREEGILATADRSACGASCRCVYFAACCIDDTWKVGMTNPAGYQVVQTAPVDWWLVKGPPMVLSKR